MGSISQELPKPWIETPLLRSAALSRAAGCNVFLKLENLQPSGSFKSRGIGNMLLASVAASPGGTPHFYCSSGGNAGLACAYASSTLNLPCTIVVPLSTSEFMISKIKLMGAAVVQVGNHWSEADAYLRTELLSKDKLGVYVPPFDHADVWRGHSTIIPEILTQLQSHSTNTPSITSTLDALVCSVGGGGLFCGLIQGLEESGLLSPSSSPHSSPPKIVTVETTGTSSFSQSLTQRKLIKLSSITSIANTLGAAQVAGKALEYGMRYREQVVDVVVGDEEAVRGMVWMADEERMLVEAACGVSVGVVAGGGLGERLFGEEGDGNGEGRNMVIVVCGGSNVSLGLLKEYRERFGV